MPTSDKMKKLAEDYGYQLGFLKSDKELYKVFSKAVDGGWDATRFVAAVRNTKWYKKHSETWRTNQQLKYADPATYQNKLDAQRASVRQMMNQIGVKLSSDQIGRLTDDSFMFGWSDQQLREQLGQYATKGGLTGRGVSGEVENALRQTAYRNGVNVTDAYIKGWVSKVAGGFAQVADAQQAIRDTYARSLAPGFQKELAAGQDLYDLASPYMQSMSKTLELNPADIDLFDPKIRSALASSNDKDGQVGSIPLWQFERDLKKDPRWMKTNNARDQFDGAARKLGQMFGMGV